MLNIAIDTTFFAHSEAKNKKLTYSTSIFAADLLDAFDKLGYSNNCTLIVSRNHSDFFAQRFPSYKQLVLDFLPLTILSKITKGKIVATGLIKKLGIYKKKIDKNHFDLIWFPYSIPENYVHTRIPEVLTIHDLYRLHKDNNPEIYSQMIDEKHNQIVTISDFTKNDILNSLGYKKDIPVIPNSISFDISETSPVESIKNPFILDINAYIDKKNTTTLLKSFMKIKDSITDIDLVCCGGYKDESYFNILKSFIDDNNISDRVHLTYQIPENQRNWLLQNAKLFVTPSLYEGFGRTPVEAAVCKIPVISTKETSLYEATMGLVHYYENSTDSDELALLIEKVLKSPDSKESLEEISDTLKSQYNSLNCAKKYWNIFLNQNK